MPAPAKEGFFRGLAGGLYSSTVEPLAHMVMHPVQTAEGIGHALAHPLDTGKALGHAVAETGRGILSGDGRSMGAAAGTIGMLFIPGAGEAGAVEDAARVGKLGELADAGKAGEVGEAADAARAGDVGDSVKEAEALASERLPATALTKEGWPDLPASQAPNFVSAEGVTLNPGDKVYRIIDDPAKAGGGYWARELPNNMAEWRSDYAVKPAWNDNGLYAEHTVTDPLNVWEGPASSQGSLAGGKDQIWMPPGTLSPTDIKPTGW